VSLRTAFASSYNVPAVKTLASLGVDKMIELGRQMGITTWTRPKTYGLSLTLGAGEVRMTDMAVVYGTVANLGKRIDLQPIIEVKNSDGNILYDGSGETQVVLEPKVAFLITDILKDNRARTPAFGPSSFLHIEGQEVAVKTGTTNDKRDNWTIGYTTERLAAVWVGNNDNTPMSAVASGITGASPIWNKIIKEILQEKETAHVFEAPDDLIKVKVCAWNGLLPCEGCPSKEEYFVKGTEPKKHCNPEQIKKIIEEREKRKKDKILEGASTERE
jgi:membrane peptidoglycan carboxypeptidase